ncbi:MAG: universal stress protein [Bacteroidales bacterium]|nr:universal stress protein [Bacteroidales bacterium]
MEDKLTTIAYHTYSRALLLQSQLEDAGIDCFLSNINIVQPAIGSGVKLKVRDNDVEKALRIIKKASDVAGKGKEKTVKQMHSVRRILLPVDFSDYSLNACQYAIGLAAKFKAEVKLFHAYFKPVMEMPAYEGAHMYQANFDKYFEEIEIKAKKQLHELVHELNQYIVRKKLGKIRISASLANGFAEEAIVEIIEKYNPGIVIMGTHGIGEQTAGIFGSVTLRLIDRLHVPLLTIPASATFKGIEKTKNILYATDFDDTDYAALNKLLNLIRLFDMKLHCVHVSIGRKKAWDSVKMDEMHNYIKEEYPSQRLKCSIMVSDNILNGLETYMRNNNIGLVSFNTHKRNMFTKLFTPSITRQALSRFSKPVFIFRSE